MTGVKLLVDITSIAIACRAIWKKHFSFPQSFDYYSTDSDASRPTQWHKLNRHFNAAL
jgi:hypothetical protein